MAYSKTTWENLPSTNTPLNATNLNKMENELDKLDPSTAYTQQTGTYTTAKWGEGTSTVTWTAPRTGLYIIWATFVLQNDAYAKVYKQLQLHGTATKISNQILFYEAGVDSTSSTENIYKAVVGYQGSALVYAQQGQTIIPYVHTPVAGVVWDVNLTGLFLK